MTEVDLQRWVNSLFPNGRLDYFYDKVMLLKENKLLEQRERDMGRVPYSRTEYRLLNPKRAREVLLAADAEQRLGRND